MTNLVIIAWVASGIIGWIIVSRWPSKLLVDSPLSATVVTILMAGLMPLWGGPIFLAYVLLTPPKKLCIRCHRAIPQKASICQHCHQTFDLSSEQLDQIARENQQRAHTLATSRAKFGKLDWIGLILWWILTPTMVLLWWMALARLGDWYYSRLGPYTVALLPEPIAWFMPALFLALGTSSYPILAIQRIILQSQWHEYREYGNMNYGSDSMRTLHIMALVCVILTLAAVWFLSNTYVLAGERALAIKRLLAPTESRYSYQDLVFIRVSSARMNSKTGRLETVKGQLYALEFSNGDHWSTRRDPTTREQQVYDDLINFISVQSQVPIQEVPVLYDKDL
jgi:hypothetical protein